MPRREQPGKEHQHLEKGQRFPRLSSGASCLDGAVGVASVPIGKPAIYAPGDVLWFLTGWLWSGWERNSEGW